MIRTREQVEADMQAFPMTFAEAMAKSSELEAAAYLAIALKLPAEARRAAIVAHIDFNPYLYASRSG